MLSASKAHSLLLLRNTPSCRWTSLLIQSPAEGHLGPFPFGSVMTTAAMNILVQIFLGELFNPFFRHKSHTEFAQHNHGPMMLQVQVKGSSGCSTSGNTRCALVPTLSLPTLVCTVLPPRWLERRARQGGNSTPLGPGHPHCHLLPLGVTLVPPLIPVSLGQCFHGRIQQILSS